MKNGTRALYTATNGMNANDVKQFDREYKKYITRNKPILDQLLKRTALAALIFALTGIGFGQWEKQWENIVKQYQIHSAQAAPPTYWEADYWKHHTRPTLNEWGVPVIKHKTYSRAKEMKLTT